MSTKKVRKRPKSRPTEQRLSTRTSGSGRPRTYPRRSRWVRTAVLALVSALVVAVAVAFGVGETGGAPSSSSGQLTSTTTSATSPATAPANPTIATLEKLAMPAPRGFFPSTASPSAGETPQQFDSGSGTSDGASIFGFLGGYSATYDSSSSEESIDFVLSAFSAPQGATSYFRLAARVNGEAAGLAPKTSTLSGMPDSEAFVGTKADSQHFYTAEVAFQVGSYVCVVSYYDNAPISSLPEVLSQFALDQYALLG